MAATNFSYDDAAIKEDLLGIITNLDYKEFQLVSGLGQSKANGVYHQWLKDSLKTPASNAAVEGADASYTARTNPTRLLNVTQIVRNAYEISGTDRASNQAGFADRFSYEMEKAMKEHKQDLEWSLMRATIACGNNSTARKMQGLKAWLTGNVTAQSGTSYSETALNDDLQAVWDDGTEVNAIYAPMYLKRRISGFTAGATKNVDASDKRLFNAVDIYQADAAKNVKLFSHRFVTQSGDLNYDIVGINEEMFKIAYLRNPKNVPLAKAGDSDRAEIISEATLECLHENAGFKRTAVL